MEGDRERKEDKIDMVGKREEKGKQRIRECNRKIGKDERHEKEQKENKKYETL